MAQRRADERMAGITAAHRFRLGEQRPGWLAKSQAFSSVMKQERNLELIKQRSDARRAASEKENAAAPESAAEAPPPTPVAAPRLASPPPPPPLMAPQQWAPWAAPKPTAEDEPAAAADHSACEPLPDAAVREQAVEDLKVHYGPLLELLQAPGYPTIAVRIGVLFLSM